MSISELFHSLSNKVIVRLRTEVINFISQPIESLSKEPQIQIAQSKLSLPKIVPLKEVISDGPWPY